MLGRLLRLFDRPPGGRDEAAQAARPDVPIREVDWTVYVSTYVDLRDIRDEATAVRHFREHGRREARVATAAALRERIGSIEAKYGALPPDFVWSDYRDNYPDLKPLRSAYAVAAHYLQTGRKEGRLYKRFDPDLYRSLYFPGSTLPLEALIEHYREKGQAAGHVASIVDLAGSEGVRSTAWLDLLELQEFALLNEAWAGPIANKGDALHAMVREGFARLAPISLSKTFDPDYYREANPGVAALPAATLYKQWLFEQLPGGRPGSASDHLGRHGLKLADFPAGFDWQSYRLIKGVFGDSRWALLDHLVANNAIAASDIPVHPKHATAFLAALATTITDRVPARAAALFAQAAHHGPLTAMNEARWGEALALQRRWAEALDHYAVALQDPHAPVTTVVAAARAALGGGRPEQAVEHLATGKAQAGGDVRWRDTVGEVVQHAFDGAWTRAEALYAEGRRSEADALLLGTVASIEGWWARLDPLGLPLAAETPRRFVLLANVDLRQCTHYRVEQKQEIFAAAGLRLDVFTQAEVAAFITALPGAAAAIFYRLPAMPMNVRAIAICRALGIPSYYDIDDLIFDPAHYPEPIETYGASVTPAFHQSLQLGVPLFRAAMTMCDYGIASTTVLARDMDGVVRKGQTFVLPNGLDSRNQDFLDFSMPKVRHNDEIVLFYGSGTKAHNSDFLDLVGEPLLEVLTRHDNVKLIVVGFLSLDERFDPVRDRIVQLGWTKSVADYWSLLAEADINLAVLVPSPTTDGKSELKWFEAAALGVPSIVSATNRYREVLDDGVDALLARTPQDWLDGLENLIANPGRRASMVEAARTKARASYSVAANADRLKALLAPAFADAGSAPGRKKRLLLVNIFFPPQTIGGSTRVVRDNLDSFLTSGFSTECDFAVVTTDNDNPVPFQLRVEDYKGVPVFRISTPLEANMEWQPFNPAIGAVFAQVLSVWQPDLVHVHSIQRLTASILCECVERGIPYINTIHDAWWLSDYHFLVDVAGRVRQPDEALPLDPPPPVTLGQSLERRRRLRPLLEASEDILCVSDTFAAMHRAAGYPRARSVPNGTPPLGPVARRPSPSGRVRLAHIGSQTHHKGYYLVMAALQRSRFANLELTVVDHSRFGGPVEQATWGATPVRIVGKTKQEEMHTFYGDQDVLLAPSLWPESFGLVAREAAAAGLWVLASDRGAIGEGVTPGVNGWVIDVSRPEPLAETLAAIDADPARYTVTPPRSATPSRTADDQARELVALYREVFDRPTARKPQPYFMTGSWRDEVKPTFVPTFPRRDDAAGAGRPATD